MVSGLQSTGFYLWSIISSLQDKGRLCGDPGTPLYSPRMINGHICNDKNKNERKILVEFALFERGQLFTVTLRGLPPKMLKHTRYKIEYFYDAFPSLITGLWTPTLIEWALFIH